MFEEIFRQMHHEYASEAVAKGVEYSTSIPNFERLEYLTFLAGLNNILDHHIYNEAASKTLTFYGGHFE